MKNIFAARKDFVEGRKRNTFDLSFQNNLTMRFGRLYPVFCKEVIPGDSFRIKPTFGLRFMPLVFPIQTRMQANLHFFYVRNRTLWKDWMDFIGRTKDGLVPPYLSAQMAKELCQTGKLGDYFGCPTTLVGEYGRSLNMPAADILYQVNAGASASYANYYLGSSADPYGNTLSDIKTWNDNESSENKIGLGLITQPFDAEQLTEVHGHRYFYIKQRLQYTKNSAFPSFRPSLMMHTAGDTWTTLGHIPVSATVGFITLTAPNKNPEVGDTLTLTQTQDGNAATVGYAVVDEILSTSSAGQTAVANLTWFLDMNVLKFVCDASTAEGAATWTKTLPDMVDELKTNFDDTTVRFILSNTKLAAAYSEHTVGYTNPNFRGAYEVSFSYAHEDEVDISEANDAFNPYANGAVKVSALPFRAYEAIYNAYYRNQLNDPFKINGTPEYNKYITNDAGGADSTVYDFFNRNWELDFLTSATQTPQQGDITPLVGVSASGQFTFDNGDGTITTVTPTLGSDGATLTGIAAYEGNAPADGSLPAGKH